jgi:hypothetical protein
MKFANLVLQSPIIRSRFTWRRTGSKKGAPAWTSHQAYRHTRLEGLFDHANLPQGPSSADDAEPT